MIASKQSRGREAAKRGDRLLRESLHDPYRTKGSLKGPTVCPGCGAVYARGHWTWDERPPEARDVRCPACRRIDDKVPAGFLTIRGGFVDAHRAEIIRLVQNVEARQKSGHPLKRIMQIEQDDAGIRVTFTDLHLARNVGDALQNAFDGELNYRYGKGEYLLRVTWQRQA